VLNGTHPNPNPPTYPRKRRIRTPTVIQMEPVECGAAALAIVLGYFGRIVSLEELRVACGISRDGSNAVNIARAARTYGLVARGFRLEVEALRARPLPLIVYWEFRHFLVVEGFDDQRVFLNDPAVGPRTVSYADFDTSFTGIVLTLEPGPDFTRGGQPVSLARGLRDRLRGSFSSLAFCVLVGVLLVLPGLLVPVFTKVFVDDILVGGLSGWVVPLLLGMGVAAVLRSVLTWLQQYFLLKLSTKLSVTMSGQFVWHILRLPMTFYAQRFSGELGWRVQLNDTVANLLSGQLATAALNIITVVFYLALMLSYDITLTLIGVGFACLNLVALQFVARKRVDLNQRLTQEMGRLMGTSMNGLQTIETLKSTGTESEFYARWAGAQARVLDARQTLAITTQFLSAGPPFLSLLTTIAILAVGGLRVMHGEMSVGTLVAFQTLMASFTQPFNDFVALGSQLQEAHGSLARLDDALHQPIDPQLEPHGEPGNTGVASRLAGNLELRNVTFGYSRLAPPLVENLSLVIRPGQRVAVVGATGSGKSTVARLVCGLVEPWSGEVLLDGKPRAACPRRAITESLALVDQEIFLLEGTIAQNLTLWNSVIPQAQVLQAARDAYIHDDITARPDGYQSLVEEAGRNFSGGQRQRLEIARALAGNPSLMVMDEATSALDPVAEQIIDANLRRRGCACLIVAHRLSTIRDCDEIIVLEHGKVAQRGTHDQLKDVDGPYARLIAG
jgi:NHLM bacteriocin system ABC transporter peptidase/ATP-binding protein